MTINGNLFWLVLLVLSCKGNLDRKAVRGTQEYPSQLVKSADEDLTRPLSYKQLVQNHLSSLNDTIIFKDYLDDEFVYERLLSKFTSSSESNRNGDAYQVLKYDDELFTGVILKDSDIYLGYADGEVMGTTNFLYNTRDAQLTMTTKADEVGYISSYYKGVNVYHKEYSEKMSIEIVKNERGVPSVITIEGKGDIQFFVDEPQVLIPNFVPEFSNEYNAPTDRSPTGGIEKEGWHYELKRGVAGMRLTYGKYTLANDDWVYWHHWKFNNPRKVLFDEYSIRSAFEKASNCTTDGTSGPFSLNLISFDKVIIRGMEGQLSDIEFYRNEKEVHSSTLRLIGGDPKILFSGSEFDLPCLQPGCNLIIDINTLSSHLGAGSLFAGKLFGDYRFDNIRALINQRCILSDPSGYVDDKDMLARYLGDGYQSASMTGVNLAPEDMPEEIEISLESSNKTYKYQIVYDHVLLGSLPPMDEQIGKDFVLKKRIVRLVKLNGSDTLTEYTVDKDGHFSYESTTDIWNDPRPVTVSIGGIMSVTNVAIDEYSLRLYPNFGVETSSAFGISTNNSVPIDIKILSGVNAKEDWVSEGKMNVSVEGRQIMESGLQFDLFRPNQLSIRFRNHGPTMFYFANGDKKEYKYDEGFLVVDGIKLSE